MDEVDYGTQNTGDYFLTSSEREELSRQLLIERPPVGESKLAVYTLETDNPYANIARSIEQKVFEGTFEGHTPEYMQEEYAPYDPNSVFFLAIDKEEQCAVGSLRVIQNATNSPHDFKTLHDLEEVFKDPSLPERFSDAYGIDDLSKVWDIGTVGALPEYRHKNGMAAGMLLYRAMHERALEHGITDYVTMLQAELYARMRSDLGIPFTPLLDLPPREHMRTFNQFAHGKVDQFLPAVERKRRVYRTLDIAARALRGGRPSPKVQKGLVATAPLIGITNGAIQP